MRGESLLGRYEYSDEKSNKFWEIIQHTDGSYEARWGRIGAAYQSTPYESEAIALKKIREKIAKGYVKVDDSKSEREMAQERVAEKRKERAEESSSAFDFMTELRKI